LPESAALFLDFDGTLAPLADRPQDVRVPGWVVPTLLLLHQRLHGALAIVSGRPIRQIDEFLRPFVVAVAGAHGAEYRGTDGRVHTQQMSFPPGVEGRARALAQHHAGLIFETKKGGFSLHFRARPELESLCLDALTAALIAGGDTPEATSDWELRRGHCVFELKQRAVSKATALHAFLAEPTFAGRLPVFVGDDANDEDGICAAQSAGGFGVRVGPGPTHARYRLADTDAVAAWLTQASGEV